jgi:branched-chain amino acid transport system ATP-binding protein
VKPLLEVNNLMVFFENAIAVNDLTFKVNKGEIVGIFGSNGAGKTTLMNTISGITLHVKYRMQREGGQRINIYGKQIFEGEEISNKLPRYRVNKGIVLSRERHPVFRDLTVEENLTLGSFLIKEKHLIKESLNLVYEIFPALVKLKKRKAGFCSGGEQEMVAIGTALMARPKLLLLDEPLLGLSPLVQKQVVQALTSIKELGFTILITEQYAKPIMPYITYGFIVENGSLAVSGSREELMQNEEVLSSYFGVEV